MSKGIIAEFKTNITAKFKRKHRVRYCYYVIWEVRLWGMQSGIMKARDKKELSTDYISAKFW